MKKLVVAAMISAGVLTANADTYDFSYKIEGGDPSFSIVQVFDNGKRTWIQPRKLDPIPVVLALTPAGQVMLNVKREGQFFVIDGVERSLDVVLAGSRVRATYTGQMARSTPPILFGPAEPIRLASLVPVPIPAAQLLAHRGAVDSGVTEAVSTAQAIPSAQVYSPEEIVAAVPFVGSKTTLGPIGRKKLNDLVQLIKSSSTVTLVSPNSGTDIAINSARYAEIVRSLTAAGVPAEKLKNWKPEMNSVTNKNGWLDFKFTIKQKQESSQSQQSVTTNAQVKAAIEPQVEVAPLKEKLQAKSVPIWRIDPSKDKLVSDALKRWCKEDGNWKLSWEAPRDFLAVEAEYSGDLEQAIEDVVFGLRESDSPVKVRFVDDGRNKTVRILKYTGNSNAAADK